MAGEQILVVDDEPGVRVALEGILADEGFAVASAATGEEGLAMLEGRSFDAALLDVWLPGIDGLETLKRLRAGGNETTVIMISGHGSIETAVRATKLGAFDFVEKPLSLERTLLVLRNALRQRRLELRNRRLLEQLVRDTEIVGRSPAVELLRDRIAAAAQSGAPVLIAGEPGTGRETVARRIHASGPRADGPFVDVPCAALSPPAAEVALFGARKGRGRIGLAAGGTLFLREVERLDPALQARLAVDLEARSADPEPVRSIASSGPEGAGVEPSLARFLEVLRLDLPPLRNRREDVALLAERFMRDLAREYGVAPKRWAAESLAALKLHDWPGNVRELRNIVERVLLFARGEVIQPHELPVALGGARAPAEDLYREFPSLDDGLRAFERYYVTRMLAEERSDRAATARRLGLTVEALEQRLRVLQV